MMLCRTKATTSRQERKHAENRQQARPEFVTQALGWVEFHRPAVQYLRQQANDPKTRKNGNPLPRVG